MKALERLFRHKVLRMLLDKGRITPETIRIMDGWRHCGFNVYCGPRIPPREKKSLERLATMGTHVSGRGQQSVRYYGFLSNASRGKRRKEEHQGAEPSPTVREPQAPPELGKNSAWARLIVFRRFLPIFEPRYRNIEKEIGCMCL